MSALSNTAEDLLLTWLLTTSSATRPTTWEVALHTGDPGEAGTASEVTSGQDADYARQSITFATPTAGSGQVLSNAAVSWTVDTASAGYTVTHITIRDGTSGNALFIGELPVARSLTANQVLTFAAGDIIAALD